MNEQCKINLVTIIIPLSLKALSHASLKKYLERKYPQENNLFNNNKL